MRWKTCTHCDISKKNKFNNEYLEAHVESILVINALFKLEPKSVEMRMRKDDMAVSMKQSEKMIRPRCDICDMIYMSQHCLIEHKGTVHQGTCDQCIIQARTKVYSNVHVQRRHGSQHESFTKDD